MSKSVILFSLILSAMSLSTNAWAGCHDVPPSPSCDPNNNGGYIPDSQQSSFSGGVSSFATDNFSEIGMLASLITNSSNSSLGPVTSGVNPYSPGLLSTSAFSEAPNADRLDSDNSAQ